MITSVLVFVPILIGELLALYHFWGDLVVITNNVFTLVGNVTFYGEALYIIGHRREFLMLMEKLQDMLEHTPRLVYTNFKNPSCPTQKRTQPDMRPERKSDRKVPYWLICD
jgi:hypothetical protein